MNFLQRSHYGHHDRECFRFLYRSLSSELFRESLTVKILHDNVRRIILGNTIKYLDYSVFMLELRKSFGFIYEFLEACVKTRSVDPARDRNLSLSGNSGRILSRQILLDRDLVFKLRVPAYIRYSEAAVPQYFSDCISFCEDRSGFHMNRFCRGRSFDVSAVWTHLKKIFKQNKAP